MKKFRLAFIIFLLLVFSSSKVFALMEETHAQLNEIIIKNIDGSFFPLNSYFKNTLNFGQGIDEIYNKRSITDWIYWGGKYEDSHPVPLIYSRSYMHFHDPTKPLSEAGFSGPILGIPTRSWDSSIIWGLSKDAQSSLNLGDYSWPTVRKYFYQALIATNKDDRENNYAETFRGIGQLMHLVEDASVPEHTRNDDHPFGFHYEVWVQSVLDGTLSNGPSFDDLIENPVDVYSTLLCKPGLSEVDSNPVSRLFDTRRYIQNVDNPGITTESEIGLAEYSNANFFSRKSAMAYDYPKNARLTFKNMSVIDPDDPNNKIARNYYSKDSDGEPVEHLAVVSLVKSYFDKYYLQDFYDRYIYI